MITMYMYVWSIADSSNYNEVFPFYCIETSLSHLQAISGKGIDRHFLGLAMIAQENNIKLPDLYRDPNLIYSKTWRISTSQV